MYIIHVSMCVHEGYIIYSPLKAYYVAIFNFFNLQGQNDSPNLRPHPPLPAQYLHLVQGLLFYWQTLPNKVNTCTCT